MRSIWKWIGLAGIAGVMAGGALVARDQRRRNAYSADDIRARLHQRLDEAGEPAGQHVETAGDRGLGRNGDLSADWANQRARRHRVQPVRAAESLEFDVAAVVEHDVPGVADGVAHRFTDQDLAAVGLPATRAAIATLRPNRSSPRRTDLPTWMPMRTRMPLGRLLSSRCTSTLHPTACSGCANATMKPSPWLFTT